MPTEAAADPRRYCDACAGSPPSAGVLEAMRRAGEKAWANPSSLHGFGIAAAECLERSRLSLADGLGCDPDEVVLCSGGTEAIHTALLGSAVGGSPGRLLISAVEHPATIAAAERLQRQGWNVVCLPVDHCGVVRLERLEELLAPPTRLVSMIWGQSEVGSLQPIEAIGARCRGAGVLLHVDAVQVVGHRAIDFSRLPVDLLSCTAHKLQGPRGVGALLVKRGLAIEPLIGGGGQEGGRRGGTEPVVLAAGFAAALEEASDRLATHGGADPLQTMRDALLARLLEMEGIRLSGPSPDDPRGRLPHHISLLISADDGSPLSGRRLVQALARQGYAGSSGSACSAGRGSGRSGGEPSPILLAMGYGEAEAASGLRLCLGPWLRDDDVRDLPEALARARRQVEAEDCRTLARP